MLISLNEAKKHLRVEHDADDDYITGLILAAQQWAENFLNKKFQDPEPDNNESEINGENSEMTNDEENSTENIENPDDEDEYDDLIECQSIHKQAMLLVLGTWYEHREDGLNNYIPYAAKNLLYPLRRVPV